MQPINFIVVGPLGDFGRAATPRQHLISPSSTLNLGGHLMLRKAAKLAAAEDKTRAELPVDSKPATFHDSSGRVPIKMT